MKFFNYKNKVAFAVCFALGVSACSSDKTAEEYISAAKVSISESKSNDAVIALKNAVRADLKNVEARTLLGSLYLNMGDAAAAEKELQRAITLGGDMSYISPKMLKALYLQNKSDETISFIDELDDITPETLLYQALTYNRLGKKEEAKQTITQANELSSDSIYSQLANAYIKANTSSIDDTLLVVDKILAIEPELTEALLLKGQLHFAKKDFSQAIKAFNDYYNLLENDVQIRLFLANAYVKNEQFSKAKKHLDYLIKLVPEHPFTNQLLGLIEYQKSDYKQALGYTEIAIQNGLDIPSNRVVAGLSAFKLEQYELAHQYLITLSNILSPTHPVRRVLALVQMQLGYSVEAGITLDGVDELTSQDINLFTTASFELLKAGKIDEARTILSKADKIVHEGSSEEIAKVGILQFSMNDLEGVANLEKAVEIDPELSMAKMALAAAYIKNNEFDKALSLAEQWKSTEPSKPEGYNLAAKVYLLKENKELAEIELNRALDINENNAYSLIYFSNKAFVNKRFDESANILKKLLGVSPNHIAALRLNYRVQKALNNTHSAIKKIESSFIKNELNMSYKLLYAKVLFIEQQYDEVISLLKNIENTDSVPAEQFALLGESYLKLSENNKALTTFDSWTKSQPKYRSAWLSKIATQEVLVDYKGALISAEQALSKAPNDSQFSVLRANYLILDKQFFKAQKQINELTDEQRTQPLVKGLQGKIWLTEGQFEKALPAIKELYSLQPNSYNTALVFATYKELKKSQAAFNFIIKHVETFPEDSASRNLLAESAISYDLVLAKKHYLFLLKSQPASLAKLNNLAWIDYQLKNYKSAMNFAEQALALNDAHPQVLDTAALIHVKLGNKKAALELLKKAKQLAPHDAEIAKHYTDTLSM